MNIISDWHGIQLEWAYGDLLRSIRRQLNCPHQSKDILHDALIRYALTSSVNRNHVPHAYLRSIVHNLIIDHHHDSVRYTSLEILPEQQAALINAAAPSSEQIEEVRQKLYAIQQLLDALPKRCREVFWLYRVEGYTQSEIAAQLGISKNMVERHVMRALLDLISARQLLKD